MRAIRPWSLRITARTAHEQDTFEGHLSIIALNSAGQFRTRDLNLSGTISKDGWLSAIAEKNECGYSTLDGAFFTVSQPDQLHLTLRFAQRGVVGATCFVDQQARTLLRVR